MRHFCQFFIRSQVLIAMVVLFGLNSTAKANSSYATSATVEFKAQDCDCLDLSGETPVFFSDRADLRDVLASIEGFGKTRDAAEREAQNMCVDQYRTFASQSEPIEVTHSGCHIYKRTHQDGEWKAI